MRINNNAPNIVVKLTTVSGEAFEVKSFEFGGDIISISTSKTMADPAGTFSLTMIGRNNFIEYVEDKLGQKFTKMSSGTNSSAYYFFLPASLIDIYINDREVMIGTVDVVSKRVTMSEGKPQRTFTITGRDFGSFLVDHKIWYDDTINKQRKYNMSMMAAISAFGIIKNDKPAVIMEKIINEWLIGVVNQNMNINGTQIEPFKFSDGQFIQDKFIALTTDRKSAYNVKIAPGTSVKYFPGALSVNTYSDLYPMQFDMFAANGDLSHYVKELASYPLNEVFVDTGDVPFVLSNKDSSYFGGPREIVDGVRGKAYLVFRPTPFDDADIGIDNSVPTRFRMQDIPRYKINDSIISEKDLKLSRNGMPSVYSVYPAGAMVTMTQSKAFTPMTYDEKALRRYGYNPMQFALNAFNFSKMNEGGTGKTIVTCKDFQNKFKSWFRNMDKMFSGSFLIMGNEEIRIGSMLLYEKDEEGHIEDEIHEGKYYITGVHQAWKYGDKFTTRLDVDRGTSTKMLDMMRA